MSDELDRPFPPGPSGPEESNVPGLKITLTPEQAQSVMELSNRCSYVSVEDRGASYLRLRMFGPEGDELGDRLIFPDGGYGTADLP